MTEYQPALYGNRIAASYDSWYPTPEEESIQFLTNLAMDGRVLELGIGTGRIAIPLRARGVRIEGIDASTAMVGLLHNKPGGSNIPVRIGDFSELKVDGRYDLIFVIFNTLFGLPTQEMQLQCLKNVASRLNDKGRFLIEAFVPDMTRFVDGQSIRTTSVKDDEVRIDVSMHDPAKQQITSQHVVLTEHGIKMMPVTIRYVWPSELDMMARVAGLKLKDRWEDWKETPFGSRSGRHISLYEIDTQQKVGG